MLIELLQIGDFGDAWPLVDDPKLTQGELIQGWGGEDVEDILPGEKKGIFKEACIIRDRGTIGYHPPVSNLVLLTSEPLALCDCDVAIISTQILSRFDIESISRRS